MLVLARKCGESLQVGDNIRISVIRTQGNRVKLAIEAPSEVRIQRGELVLEVDATGTSACQPAAATSSLTDKQPTSPAAP